MKRVIAVVKESAYDELYQEVPELFKNETVVIKVVDDWSFDHWMEIKEREESVTNRRDSDSTGDTEQTKE